MKKNKVKEEAGAQQKDKQLTKKDIALIDGAFKETDMDKKALKKFCTENQIPHAAALDYYDLNKLDGESAYEKLKMINIRLKKIGEEYERGREEWRTEMQALLDEISKDSENSKNQWS
ncbi:hypothetical protein ENBRE01_1895 [Enteropsectra breve]|nr:hypothetical protein ENBRE01_1895 [Enteropsectra breve]